MNYPILAVFSYLMLISYSCASKSVIINNVSTQNSKFKVGDKVKMVGNFELARVLNKCTLTIKKLDFPAKSKMVLVDISKCKDNSSFNNSSCSFDEDVLIKE